MKIADRGDEMKSQVWDMAWRTLRESVKMMEEEIRAEAMCSRANWMARASAVKMDAREGIRTLSLNPFWGQKIARPT